MKTRTIRQQVFIPGAEPEELYEWLMDSRKHTRLTGDTARLSRKVGAKFTAGGGYITGRNLELTPGLLIVQEWRGEEDDWPEDHYSIARFRFSKVRGGARLDFTQRGVPDKVYEMIRDGWWQFYWQPLKELASRR